MFRQDPGFLALSPEDTEARSLFLQWTAPLNLHFEQDAIGNMFLRRAGTHDTASPVAFGSHLDTVPTGGRFDGVFGVLAGWAQQVRLERGLTSDETPTVDTERRLLSRHLDWICAQYWVRDLWDQLRRLDRALRAVRTWAGLKPALAEPFVRVSSYRHVDNHRATLGAW